jgi:hypothetical protein
MKKLFIGLCGVFFAGAFFAELRAQAVEGSTGGQGAATLGNGDVNGDDALDLSDAIYLLTHLFQGGPAPIACPVLGSPEVCDNNVDDDLDGNTDCDDLEDCETDFSCLEPGDASLLPDTSVTDCYDAAGNIDPECDDLPGQDGSYQTGCQPLGRFVVDDGGTAGDTTDDTVTDNCTGLMWQLDGQDGPDRAVWWEALVTCEDLVLAGFDDWRLPNLHELASLIDYSTRNPSDPLGPAVPPEFRDHTEARVARAFYHSSTFYPRPSFTCSGPIRVWGVSGATGGIGASGTRNIDAWNFRAVRTVVPAGGGAARGQGAATSGNGDVNGDDALDLSDAIYLLTHLFQGGPMPVACPGGAAGGGAGIGAALLPPTGQTACYYFEIPPPETPPENLPNFQRGLVTDPECDDDPDPADVEESPGQDPTYAATVGCSTTPRFVDNGDGTITDNCTNLMWQQDTADTNGGGITGSSTPICCDRDDNIVNCNGSEGTVNVAVELPDDGLTWSEALAYCENLTFAEHSDWRLPNVRELRSIVDHSTATTATFPDFTAVAAIPPNGDGYRFWTSTPDSSTSAQSGLVKAWYVQFCSGNAALRNIVNPCTLMPDRLYVRAVRTVTQ